MDEFGLIQRFFNSIAISRTDVLLGIGDDAARLIVPHGFELLVSCDTLVSDVHFLPSWDPYDIAWKAVMVNVSDIAAMGGSPSWLSLALTLPALDESWLNRFSTGLKAALSTFNIALIGGDTTRGPLSMSLTIHGFVEKGRAVTRSGAEVGDRIFVSGELGAAALAVEFMNTEHIDLEHQSTLLEKLKHPIARIDLAHDLQTYATAAIDLSDGLSGDLMHICEQSQVGACILLDALPIHPLVAYYQEDACEFVLRGGDDYELCFTIPAERVEPFHRSISEAGIACYEIGVIEKDLGLRAIKGSKIMPLIARSYVHF